MRTTMKERKENAKRFYNMFMNSNCKKVAIVVQRMESSNPNISRCQFIAVPTSLWLLRGLLCKWRWRQRRCCHGNRLY